MRISRCLLLSAAGISSFCYAAAFNEQQIFRASREQQLLDIDNNSPRISLSPSVDVVVMTNTLSEYYENIVDQVMATLTEDVMASAPYSFMSIFRLRPVHQDAYQPVLRSFVHALKDHLNLLRVNLLASVRPLVESNMAGVLPAPGDTISRGGTISSAELTKDILSLNQRMGAQLGLIVNAREAADTIIDQSLPDSPDLAQSTTDDEREPAQDNRRQLQQQQQQQHLDTPFVFRRRQMIQRHQSRNLARIESLLCTVQHDFTHPPIDSKAADAMTNWLSSWLSDIEQILSVEFDERVQDATQSILEDFLVDE